MMHKPTRTEAKNDFP